MRIFARKKPVVIEAIQYTGLVDSTYDVIDFCGKDAFFAPDGQLKIHTLEGDHIVSISDMVIRGVNGEYYPCKKDIFDKTYELVTAGDEPLNVVTNQAQAVDPAEKPQNFSWALQWLKDGHKVARLGWNGKGQWVTMQNGSTVLGSMMRNENSKNFYGDREVKIRPHLDIKTADDSYVCGWVPSTGDLFAEDWVIVKD